MQLTYITEPRAFDAAVAALNAEQIIGVDIETAPLERFAGDKKAGLNPYLSRPRLLSAACLDGRVFVFDLDQVSIASLRTLCSVPWACYSAQFEWQHLTHAGLTLGLLHDAQLLDTLHAGQPRRKLVEVAADHLGMQLDKSLQVSDWTAAELSSSQLEYAAADALATVRLMPELMPRIERDDQMRLYQLWRKMSPIMASASLRGQRFDWLEHERLRSVWEEQAAKSQKDLEAHLGPDLNPRSAPQLSAWIADNVPADRLANWPRTKTGNYSTDKDTLPLFADLPAVQPLLKFKALQKLVSTYGNKYAQYRNPVTDRMHPSFSVPGAVTGRSSSANPNVQQIPRGKEFRSLFLPDSGFTLIGADFGQIELRTVAALSGDAMMLENYRDGQDLHRRTAAMISEVPIDAVTPEQRQRAKCINFGIIYGQTPLGLARSAKLQYGVDMTEADAEHALERFHRGYPGVTAWKGHQIDQAQRYGKIRTRLGLIRRLTGSRNQKNRQAFNTPVQGSAAEVLYESIVLLPTALDSIGGEFLMQVHDEILLQVPTGSEQEAVLAVECAMRSGLLEVFPEAEELGINGAGLVDVNSGQSWSEVH